MQRDDCTESSFLYEINCGILIYTRNMERKRYEKDNFGYAACSLHDGDRNADDGICEEVVRDL